MQRSTAAGGHGLDEPWLQSLPRPVIALRADGTVVGCNRAAGALFGDLSGQPFAVAALPEDERGGFEEVLRLAVGGASWSGELRITVHGALELVQMGVAPVRGSDGDALLGLILTVDVVAPGQDRAVLVSQRLTRLSRVAAELQGAEDLKTLTDVVITHLADAAGATSASLSVLVDDQTLALIGIRGGTEGAASKWATYPADDSTPAGTSLRLGRPLMLSGRAAITEAYPTLELAAEGERSLLCLPLVIGDRAIGVTSLSYPGRRELDDAELEYFRIMADTCAQALERIQAQETVADQNEKLRFLAEASAELASSLDYESTLRNVAWLAVPGFADWCAIALEQDGILRTLAVAHKDPEQLALAEDYERRYPPDPAAPGGSYHVLRTGETLLVPEITEEMLESADTDPARLDMVRALGLRSVLTVALRARGRTFGTIAWVSGETGRRFGPDDVPFGEDLARRAATAIDNALLHSELREIAERLQQAVVPPEMPRLDGWHLTASYSSAGRVSVGGDFYDAIPLQDGRLAVAIGDVMGRGVQAAAAMSQIRAALRAFVAVDADPRAVMRRLDVLYDRFPTEQLVTLLYAVADPDFDEVVISCAGHPPPLLLDEDGSARFIEAAQGTLLGVGPAPRSTTSVPFVPGQTLLLFTDGLLERRGEDLDVSKERLREACRSLRPGAADEDLDRLAAVMRDPTRDDDVALLAVRRLGPGRPAER